MSSNGFSFNFSLPSSTKSPPNKEEIDFCSQETTSLTLCSSETCLFTSDDVRLFPIVPNVNTLRRQWLQEGIFVRENGCTDKKSTSLLSLLSEEKLIMQATPFVSTVQIQDSEAKTWLIYYYNPLSPHKVLSLPHSDVDDGYINLPTQNDAVDIIPGKYYGGFKIWSCAVDLASYLWKFQTLENLYNQNMLNSSSNANSSVDEKSVLELGCGQGIPGIVMILLGAKNITFQDYNEEVLDFSLLPNIGINLSKYHNEIFYSASSGAEKTLNLRCTSGDWKHFIKGYRERRGGPPNIAYYGGNLHIKLHESSQYESHKSDRKRYSEEDIPDMFDCILGGDITFDQNACGLVAEFLDHALAFNGVAFIASKEYYFGTNGGIIEFMNCIENLRKRDINYKVFSHGLENKRELQGTLYENTGLTLSEVAFKIPTQDKPEKTEIHQSHSSSSHNYLTFVHKPLHCEVVSKIHNNGEMQRVILRITRG